MTSGEAAGDRRKTRRVDGSRIEVALRPRGRLGALPAMAVDFSRYGIAVHIDQPLPKDRPVYLSLRCDELRVDNLVGIVHNCVRQGQRFRCGIRFRPSSELQQDRVEVELALERLERTLLVPETRRA